MVAARAAVQLPNLGSMLVISRVASPNQPREALGLPSVSDWLQIPLVRRLVADVSTVEWGTGTDAEPNSPAKPPAMPERIKAVRQLRD